ncbi:carbamoyltransferase C-terminal domain-containing protein [Trinickia fusca]|nr:carbamoyltransferase C-terminal domain-containing protein [Trinickia fusca]
MSTVYGEYGPRLKLIPRLVKALVDQAYSRLGARSRFFGAKSAFASQKGRELAARLQAGEALYLMGIGPFGHNTGIALVKVSARDGIEVIANNEEERFSGEKHTNKFPEHSIEAIKETMARRGIAPQDIFAVLASWDYIATMGFDLRVIFEHAPRSLVLMNPKYDPTFNLGHLIQALSAPQRLSRQLGLDETLPIIGMHHHSNHAYLSYAMSPFAGSREPVLVTVLDGTGDNGAISLYVVRDGVWECLRENESTIDSLGHLYGYLSSTQGGWSFLSSEGRYMGAAAWGNGDRLTNPYYRRLRQILYLARDGQVFVNRRMINWHVKSHMEPYAEELVDILGAPIKPSEMWNPDRVLEVENIQHSPITQDRVDKAQALQMVFEDALTHIVEHLIRKTSASKLVMTGGTALNCIANMNLLKSFNREYFKRYLGQDTFLRIWVPPIPGDAGAALGATIQFAAKNGAPCRVNLESPYLCGVAASGAAIAAAVHADGQACSIELGNINDPNDRDRIAELLAHAVSNDAVVGVFQGPAETGPRALGNRSILANPCNVRTLDYLNAKVKRRERVRPLAPMVTLKEAKRLFELDEGAEAADYTAYDYMVLTVRATALAKRLVPAVVHFDGTSRIQIVRERTNPLIYAFLKAMGVRCGVEASVNTSLNVGSPIAQTPAQALQALSRAKAMDGLIMVDRDGRTYAVWRDTEQYQSKLPIFVDDVMKERS